MRFCVFCLLLVLSFSSLVLAQRPPLTEVYVVADLAFLRESPEAGSKAKVVLHRGDRLYVQPSFASGWYIGSKIPLGKNISRTVHIIGYIQAQFVGTKQSINEEQQQKRIASKSSQNIRAPKTIILDTSPDQSPDEPIAKPPSRPLTSSNYCSPPSFCPDIAEVHTALMDNEEKFSKGKFEKTVDWEKRMNSVLNEVKLGGGRTAGDTMTFLYEVGTGSLTAMEEDYDADSEKWTFPVSFPANHDQACIPLSSGKTGGLFCLVVNDKLSTVSEFDVSMPTALASVNDKKIQIAFVGKIVPPYIWTNLGSSIRDILAGIHFQIQEIICINPKTGQKWKVEYKAGN